MRKEYNILMEKNGKPYFNKWRLDIENRDKIDPRTKIPDYEISSRIPGAIMKYLHDNYADYADIVPLPGNEDDLSSPDLCVAVTREGARDALRNFIHKRFANFGQF